MKLKITILFTMLIIVSTIIIAQAETLTPLYNVDDSNQYVNLLIDAMRNDAKYDTGNQFIVVRTGENEYKLAFGRKLNGEVTVYRYQTATYQTQARLDRYTSSQASVTENGLTYVGNVKGSLSSAQEKTYTTQAVLVLAISAILVLLGFKVFKKTIGAHISYYGVKR